MGDVNDRDPIPGFRDQLVAAGGAYHARRRRRTVAARRAVTAAGAVLVVVIAAVAAMIGGGDPAGASVTITRVGDHWEVVVAGDDVTAAAVAEALVEHGVAADVAAVPVGPSRVGQFVSGDDGVRPAGGQLSASTVRFPVTDRSVRLLFGRPAGPGEDYLAVSDAFAAGEPLECVSDVWGAPAAPAVRKVAARFVDVTVLDADGQPVEGPVDGVVGDVLVVGPGRAIIRLGDGPSPAGGIVEGTSECPVG